jgi:hypothetical protein
MALPSNGITPEVFREMMPRFILGADLIHGILAAIPPPPARASTAWRRTRISRIIEETAAFLPADAAQGRLSAQILILRDVADDTMGRSHAPELTVDQMCRVRRTADKLVCTAERLERALGRRQQLPTPFWGNVAPNALDVAVLDAGWCREAAVRTPPGDCPGGEAVGDGTDGGAAAEGAGAAPDGGAVADGVDGAAGLAVGPVDDGAGEVVAIERGDAGAGADAGLPGVTDDDARDAAARRAGVTVERGDGWSLEIWPARRGLDAAGADAPREPMHLGTVAAEPGREAVVRGDAGGKVPV